jgi:hypothetical protein
MNLSFCTKKYQNVKVYQSLIKNITKSCDTKIFRDQKVRKKNFRDEKRNSEKTIGTIYLFIPSI